MLEPCQYIFELFHRTINLNWLNHIDKVNFWRQARKIKNRSDSPRVSTWWNRHICFSLAAFGPSADIAVTQSSLREECWGSTRCGRLNTHLTVVKTCVVWHPTYINCKTRRIRRRVDVNWQMIILLLQPKTTLYTFSLCDALAVMKTANHECHF